MINLVAPPEQSGSSFKLLKKVIMITREARAEAVARAWNELADYLRNLGNEDNGAQKPETEKMISQRGNAS